MASTNVPRIHGWGNLSYLLLSGALGPSLLQGGGLRTPFLFGPRLIGVAAPTRPRVRECASVHFPLLLAPSPA